MQAPLGQILKIGTSLKAVIFAYALKLPVHHVKSQGRIALSCMPLAKKIKDSSVEALVLTLQSLEPLGSIFNKIPSSLTSESLSEADIVGLKKKNKENT